MATSKDFIEFVVEQLRGSGDVRYRKMFGEYMVYVNDKPLLLVCDNTVYVKILDELSDKMQNAAKGSPYQGAKEHYILDIDNAELSREIVAIMEPLTKVPVPKKKKPKA